MPFLLLPLFFMLLVLLLGQLDLNPDPKAGLRTPSLPLFSILLVLLPPLLWMGDVWVRGTVWNQGKD